MYSDNGAGKYEIQKVTSLNQDRNGQIAYEAEGYTYNPSALADNSPSQIKVSRKKMMDIMKLGTDTLMIELLTSIISIEEKSK